MDLHLFQRGMFLGWDVMGLAGERAGAGKRAIAGAEAGAGAGVGA